MRFMIFGFGAVAKSLLRILRKENIVRMSDLLIAECNEKRMANADAGCSIPDINEREPAVFLLQTEFILFEENDGVRRVISLEEERDEADSLFEFNISKQYSTGNFVCEAEYSANRYSKERMEKFMDDYANKLKLLLLAGPETKVQDILKDSGQPA